MPTKPPTVPTDLDDPAVLENYKAELDKYAAELQAEATAIAAKDTKVKEAEGELKNKLDQLEAKELLVTESQADNEQRLKDLEQRKKEFNETTDFREKELQTKEKEIKGKEDAAVVKKALLDSREENLKSLSKSIDSKTEKQLEENIRLETEESHLKLKEVDLREKQAQADKKQIEAEALLRTNQAEERRLKTLELELGKGSPIPPTPGTGDKDLVQKQQELLDKLVSIEADREKRLKKEDTHKSSIGKNFKPPIFKGVDGERPEAHMLRATDWMDASNIDMTEEDKIKNFRLTLDHLAREWYDNADCKDTWKNLKDKFCTYYSTQGKSIRHLHQRWKDFKFVPYKTDIDKYIRDVKEVAHRLRYDDEAVAEMLKSTMPNDTYSNVFKMTKLDDIISYIRDIYARKLNPDEIPDPANPTAATGVTPFNIMKGVGGTDQYMFIDANGQVKPFKPYVTPRGRGRGGRGRGGRGRGRGVTQGYPQQQQNFQGRGQFQFRGNFNRPRGRGRGGQKFDKSPNQRKPRVNSKTPNQDSQRCFNCNDIGHWKNDCPQKQNKPNGGNNQTNEQNNVPVQKPFPGYNVVYQPQMYPQMPVPQQMMGQQQQGPAMMGEISDVMMQMRDFTTNDSPVYMNITEVTSPHLTPLN